MSNVPFWIAGIGLLLWGLHRLALWLERRGWLFYIHRRRSTGASGLFLEANSLFDPGARYALEAKRLDEAREAERERDDVEEPEA